MATVHVLDLSTRQGQPYDEWAARVTYPDDHSDYPGWTILAGRLDSARAAQAVASEHLDNGAAAAVAVRRTWTPGEWTTELSVSP
jgi:hypothetical protein